MIIPMPLVRLRGRAFALALGGVLAGACTAVPPPVFGPPATAASGPETHQVDVRLVSFDGVTAAPR
jgi:hypothetical protein